MTSPVIALTVNGEARSFPEAPTVGQLVDALGKGRAGVAVARNAEVVPRSVWDDERLRDGDEIEVLTAVQGG